MTSLSLSSHHHSPDSARSLRERFQRSIRLINELLMSEGYGSTVIIQHENALCCRPPARRRPPRGASTGRSYSSRRFVHIRSITVSKQIAPHFDSSGFRIADSQLSDSQQCNNVMWKHPSGPCCSSPRFVFFSRVPRRSRPLQILTLIIACVVIEGLHRCECRLRCCAQNQFALT